MGGTGSSTSQVDEPAATRRVTTALEPIPLSSPYIDEREEELVLEVLRSGRLSLGPMIDRFEALFAERVGAPYAAAVSSGTAGLHLLLPARRPRARATRRSPRRTRSSASANCVIYEGATPVFADIDPRTLNLDPAAVEAAMTPRTKAIVAVDIFGYPCELEPLQQICDRHGLALIQDACEALGAEYRGARVGSHGPSASFAFYPNKQMTTGEGGMVTTHSEEEWSLLKSLRTRAGADAGGWLEHSRLGYNYRIDDLRAAVGIGQLEKLDLILELRAAVAARYGELLADVEGLEMPLADDADHRRSWFVYVVTLDRDVDRERVIGELERQGVATTRYLPSIHLQPYMRERYGFAEGLCPVSEELSQRTLALPFFTPLAPRGPGAGGRVAPFARSAEALEHAKGAGQRRRSLRAPCRRLGHSRTAASGRQGTGGDHRRRAGSRARGLRGGALRGDEGRGLPARPDRKSPRAPGLAAAPGRVAARACAC